MIFIIQQISHIYRQLVFVLVAFFRRIWIQFGILQCWNTHCIYPSRRDTIPGIPDELYFFPEETGGHNMQAVNQHDIDKMEEFLQDFLNNDMADTDCFTDYCEYIYRFEELDIPKDWNSAKSLFSMIIFYAYTAWSYAKEKLKNSRRMFFSVKKKNRKFTFVWFYSFSLPGSKAFKLIKLKKLLRFAIDTETTIWLLFYDLHVCTIKEDWVRQR